MKTLHLAMSSKEARICCNAANHLLNNAYYVRELYSSAVDSTTFSIEELEKLGMVLHVVPRSSMWFSKSDDLREATDAIVRELTLARLGI